jgi:hypothetical protein
MAKSANAEKRCAAMTSAIMSRSATFMTFPGCPKIALMRKLAGNS